MPKKRNETVHRMRGDGTIYYLKARNQWVGLLNLGADSETGLRKRISVAGKTPEEVSLKLANLRTEHAKGQAVVVTRDLLCDWLDRWYTVFYEPFVKANTAMKARGNMHRIKSGPLARMAIGEITQERVQGWVNKLADTYSEATIVTTLSTLNLAFGKLVEQKRLILNPAEHVRIPKKARRAEEARAMDEPTMKKFIEAAMKSKYGVPILFMLHTGLRAGELSALDIGDYKPTLRIAKTWSNALNAVQQEAKTASSNRNIPRPKALDDMMTAYMFQLHRKAPTDPLFQTVTYPYTRLKPWHLDGIVGRIADEIGEPWITPHTARHSFASTLFRQGIRINVVSKLLGHKDVATTYKIYIHMIPEEMDEAVDAVGKVMMGGIKCPAPLYPASRAGGHSVARTEVTRIYAIESSFGLLLQGAGWSV